MSKPAVDALQIYLQAESFRRADERLRRCEDDPEFLTIVASPALVMSAFACELYLKCLVHVETGNLLRGHHLHHLFLQLSYASRVSIENKWNAYIPSQDRVYDAIFKLTGERAPRTLTACLLAGSKAFEELRYSYEKMPETSFMLGDLPRMLRTTILELRPFWQNISRGQAVEIMPPR